MYGWPTPDDGGFLLSARCLKLIFIFQTAWSKQKADRTHLLESALLANRGDRGLSSLLFSSDISTQFSGLLSETLLSLIGSLSRPLLTFSLLLSPSLPLPGPGPKYPNMQWKIHAVPELATRLAMQIVCCRAYLLLENPVDTGNNKTTINELIKV